MTARAYRPVRTVVSDDADRCPFCGSWEIGVVAIEDEGTITTVGECVSCRATWSSTPETVEPSCICGYPDHRPYHSAGCGQNTIRSGWAVVHQRRRRQRLADERAGLHPPFGAR